MQAYWTIAESFSYEKVIEKSKFIANFKRIEIEKEGREFIEQIAKAHPFATHNCYAMIADREGKIQRFSDDGEPQGTAGIPILEVLKNKKIYQVVVVVTRYFGGVKLGVGGLVRAYTSTVADALTKDKLCQCIQSQIIEIQNMQYEYFATLKTVLQQENCVICNVLYTDTITLKVALPLEKYAEILDRINNILCGRLQYILREIDYLSYSQNKEK